MIAACILCTFVLLLIEFHLNRDVASPSFLMGVIWLFAYSVIFCFTPSMFVLDNLYFASFFACFAMFFAGVNACVIGRAPSREIFCVSSSYQWNPILKYFVFAVEYVFALIVFFKSLQLMSMSTLSAWRTLHGAVGEEDVFSTGYFGVMLNVVPVIFFISLGLYLIKPCFTNRKDLLITFPPVVLSMLFTTRGNWFFFIITMIYMVIYIKRPSNRKISLYGLFSFVIIMGVWVISSLDKYEYSMGTMNEYEKIQYLFGSYFVNPMLNFVQWFEDPVYSGGLHTFRFACAVLHSLGFDYEVVPTIQPFLNINGILSNVYTAVNWYVQDFGVGWAMAVYFVLGFVYGYLYKLIQTSSKIDLRVIVILSMLMMPIVNQFFDEKLLSIFSIWMQRFITVFVLTCPLFIVKKVR